jgi:hypothetical protein
MSLRAIKSSVALLGKLGTVDLPVFIACFSILTSLSELISCGKGKPTGVGVSRRFTLPGLKSWFRKLLVGLTTD